eukprot:102832-Hanusia_phi.AAC.1
MSYLVNGSWNQSRGELVFPLKDNLWYLGLQYNFSFQIRNPMAALVTSAVYVSFMRGSVGIVNQEAFPILSGQAYPIFVQAPGFIKRVVGQTNPFPGGLNDIVITLQPNSEIPKDSLLMIGGFHNLNVTSTLTYTSQMDLFAANFTWQSDDVLKLTTSAVWSVDVLQILTLHVVNTVGYRAARTLTVEVYSNASGSLSVLFNQEALYSDNTSIPPALGALPGDASPFKVQAPSFIHPTISQSCAYPSCLNTFTVYFALNVPLRSGDSDVILIKGLIGMISDMFVGLLPEEQGNGANLLLSKDGSTASSALWNQSTSSLMLKVAEGKVVMPNVTYGFQFTATNPSLAQAAPQVLLAHAGNTKVISEIEFPKSTVGLLSQDGVMVGTAAALQVLPRHFEFRKTVQTTSYPEAVNTITISLVPTTVLSAGTALYFSQFQGASSITGSNLRISNSLLGLPPVNDSARWSDSAKTLVTYVLKDFQPGSLVRLSFAVKNPPYGQSPPHIRVTASLSVANVSFPANHGCLEDAVLSSLGGGGRGFIGNYVNSTKVVVVVDRGLGYTSVPLIIVTSGGRGCYQGVFEAHLEGTSLPPQIVDAEDTSADSRTLFVQPRALLIAEALQTTSYPNARNKITI